MNIQKEYTDLDFMVLKLIRISMNLSQKEFAGILGVSNAYINMIEKNERTVSDEVLVNWLELLNISYDDYIKLDKYILNLRKKDMDESLKYSKSLLKALLTVYPELQRGTKKEESVSNRAR